MWIKIFFSILSLLVIFFVSSITFFWGEEKSLSSYFNNELINNGYFSITKTWSWDYLEKSNNEEWLFNIIRFNYINTIFLDKKEDNIKISTWSSIRINVNKWKYFFSFWEARKYEVSWSWYRLMINWPINFFINSEDSSNVSILPLDNTIDLILLWLEDGEEKTTVNLFPHILFSFKTSLNKILYNSDLLRIQQLNSLSYIKDSLYSKNLSLTDYERLDNNFFKDILNYFNFKYLKNKEEDLNQNTNFDIWMYDNIKKYFSIFINENKKAAYYKDLIYINLIKIWYLDILDKNLYKETETYFQELKDLNNSDYNEMLKYLIYFKEKNLFDYDITDNYIAEKKNYDEMYSSILWFQWVNSDYLIYSIFNSYDLWEKDKFFNWLATFSDNFLWANWIKISNNKLLWDTASKNVKLWYYILFLEDIIKANLTTDFNINDVKYIFDIFNKYSLLSVDTYSSLDNNKKKTLIVFHLWLLKNLEQFFRYTFFDKKLENDKILVKKSWVEIWNNLVLSFEKSFNVLLDFYTKNKLLFNESLEKDSLYLKDYNEVIWKFTEYISALKDYDKYKLDKNYLWDVNTVQINDNKVYTIYDITDFLSKFNWLYNDSYKVSTVDNKIYSVDMNLWWKNIKFDLYPYDSFYLKNLYINWEKKSVSYNLNNIKEKILWEQPQTNGEKNTDSFSNFFIDTFINNSVKNNDNNVIVDDTTNNTWTINKEDMYILIFKRDKLLWPAWEFNILKDFTKISDNNVDVKYNNWEYLIKINNLEFSFKYWDSIYWAFLSSDYKLSNTSHYFYNMTLKLFREIWAVKSYWLWSKQITVKWELDIRNFEKYMNSILLNYPNIAKAYGALYKKSNNINVVLWTDNIIVYSFIFNWKNFEISLDKDNIVSIKVDWSEKLKSPFNIDNLNDYINLLVK